MLRSTFELQCQHTGSPTTLEQLREITDSSYSIAHTSVAIGVMINTSL